MKKNEERSLEETGDYLLLRIPYLDDIVNNTDKNPTMKSKTITPTGDWDTALGARKFPKDRKVIRQILTLFGDQETFELKTKGDEEILSQRNLFRQLAECCIELKHAEAKNSSLEEQLQENTLELKRCNATITEQVNSLREAAREIKELRQDQTAHLTTKREHENAIASLESCEKQLRKLTEKKPSDDTTYYKQKIEELSAALDAEKRAHNNLRHTHNDAMRNWRGEEWLRTLARTAVGNDHEFLLILDRSFGKELIGDIAIKMVGNLSRFTGTRVTAKEVRDKNAKEFDNSKEIIDAAIKQNERLAGTKKETEGPFPGEAQYLAHAFRTMRNRLLHDSEDIPGTREKNPVRILCCILAATLIWPNLDEYIQGNE